MGLIYLDLDKSSVDHQITPDSPQDILSEQSSQTDPSGTFKIFVSYGRKNAEHLAQRLLEDLVAKGHQVWLDRAEILSGSSWEEQIEEAILSNDVFISLLTPHAVRRPDGVCLDEISMARFHNRKIVPVMVIQCRPPLSIYRLDWVDFIDWQSDRITPGP